jgi:predicted phage terminase large subunit-like protein
MKSSERADYSVGTVWQVQDEGRQLHLVDLVRDRFEFPDLVKATVSLHRKWEFDGRYQNLIIEDKGSGTSLIQALKQERIYAETQNIHMNGDKIMRLEAQTQQFAGGIVHFPKNAPWLEELLAELLGFPGVRHDDQVDSVSQALAYITWIELHRVRYGGSQRRRRSLVLFSAMYRRSCRPDQIEVANGRHNLKCEKSQRLVINTGAPMHPAVSFHLSAFRCYRIFRTERYRFQAKAVSRVGPGLQAVLLIP